MENVQQKLEEVSTHVSGYMNTLYELSLLRVTQKAVNATALTITGFTIVIFTLLILLFGGIALGWWLGDVMNSRAAGFLVAAGFYLLCLLLILFFRKKIIFPMIRDRIVRKIYNE